MKPIKLLSFPLLTAALQLFVSATSMAGTTPQAPVLAPTESDPWAHVLLQLDFSDHYITPPRIECGE